MLCADIGKLGVIMDLKQEKKVSVIMPVYNGEQFLKLAIESILKQTYKNFELIIVNDNSTDNSQVIVEEFKKVDDRIKLINNEKNLKLPSSLNVGFKASTGDYLTWTSDDNMLFPNMLDKLVVELNNGASFVYANMDYIDRNGNKMPIQTDRGNDIWRENVVGACFMYTREVYEKVGEYDKNAFLVEDYDYWLRVALNYRLSHINEVLYSYRIHDNSLSGTRLNEVLIATITQLKKYIEKDEIDINTCNKIRMQFVHYYYRLGMQGELKKELKYLKGVDRELYNSIDIVLRLNQFLPKKIIEILRKIK